MEKFLRLRRETLVELADEHLATLAGGDQGLTSTCTCTTCYCNTIHYCQIPTLPLRDCPFS